MDSDEPLPVARTFQRWFKKNAVPEAPPGKRPTANSERATRPHEAWQMDAKDQILLKNSQRVSWLRVVDEFTGAVLRTCVFEQVYFSSVTPNAVQKVLQTCFSRWGRPKAFRVDNGHPWGSAGDFPTDVSLWLIGLGIEMIWNPPCRPDMNGVVERCQGVGTNWAEPRDCGSPKQLQKRLDKMDHIHREEYPHLGYKSRMEAYPQLKSSRRHYDLAWQAKHWSMKKVLDHLSGYLVTRRVDNGGTISIYNRNYYVGKHHKRKEVFVYIDPLEVTWVCSSAEGEQLRTFPADQISKERIMQLDVTKRRNKPK
jgi:transposase InsO family protein